MSGWFWHRPYHSQPTPPLAPIPHLTNHMTQSDPHWATVHTAQSTFTTGNSVRSGSDSGSKWATVATVGGVAVDLVIGLGLYCL